MARIRIAGGVELSRIAYGMWRLANDPDTSPDHVRAKVEACLGQGITTMDHADIYGGYKVEEIFGEALRDTGLRRRIEIVTKCGIVRPSGRYPGAAGKHYDTSADHIRASVEHSLRLIGTDYIDLLLIHRPDPFMDHFETGNTLDALVQEGKVRAVGVSNFRPWDHELLQSAMTTPLATNQIELSLEKHDAFTSGDVAHFQRHEIPLTAWSPLAGGRLMQDDGTSLGIALDKVAREQGVDRAAVAVAWLLAHPAQILPVLGTNNLERIRSLSDAMRVRIDRSTWFALYTAAMGRDVL
ncbi:aldo/keto reductase [Microvirga puerhi]|uniref:Aldo/keto reductase n=1 Tax=Microvirga puerhi TaxID=2876078 RepID=A0ABS7VSY0_9HYPH|nr:aldo/keto reductase [Microvirga puerhi]